jgi:hypothetical protein
MGGSRGMGGSALPSIGSHSGAAGRLGTGGLGGSLSHGHSLSTSALNGSKGTSNFLGRHAGTATGNNRSNAALGSSLGGRHAAGLLNHQQVSQSSKTAGGQFLGRHGAQGLAKSNAPAHNAMFRQGALGNHPGLNNAMAFRHGMNGNFHHFHNRNFFPFFGGFGFPFFGGFGFGGFGFGGFGFGGFGLYPFGFGYYGGFPWWLRLGLWGTLPWYGYGLGYGYGGYGGYGGYYYNPYCVYGYPDYVGMGGYYYPEETPDAIASTEPAVAPKTAGKDEDNAKVFAEKGESDFKARDYKAAVYAWKHAVVDEPTNGVLTMMLAQAFFATGQYNEAAGAVQQAMQLLPKEEWGVVIKNYKELYSNIQDFTDQLRALEKAVKEKPNDPALRFLAGFQYAYLGYPKEAIDQLEKGLKFAPRDQMARKLREELKAKLPKPAEPPSPAKKETEE